jgi:GTPase SAR1 family protein
MKEQTIKAVIVGDEHVGKTTWLRNWFMNDEQKHVRQNIQSTLCVDFVTKYWQTHGIKWKCMVWDISGAKGYRSITQLYVKMRDIVFFVFRWDKMESIEHLFEWKTWMDSLQSSVHRNMVRSSTALLHQTKPSVQPFLCIGIVPLNVHINDATHTRIRLYLEQLKQMDGYVGYVECNDCATVIEKHNIMDSFTQLLEDHMQSTYQSVDQVIEDSYQQFKQSGSDSQWCCSIQ